MKRHVSMPVAARIAYAIASCVAVITVVSFFCHGPIIMPFIVTLACTAGGVVLQVVQHYRRNMAEINHTAW